MFCHWVGVCSLLLLWWNAVGNPFVLKSALEALQRRETGWTRGEMEDYVSDIFLSVESDDFQQRSSRYESNESHWSSVCSRLTDLIWSVFLPATPADPSVTSLWQSATVNYHADMILTESHSNFKWLTCQSHLPTHEHTSTHWWFAPGANGNKKKSPTTQKVFFFP